MATAAELRYRIRQLEDELAAVSREQEQLRRRMEQSNAEEIKALERRLQTAITENQQQMRAENLAKITALQEELTARMQDQIYQIQKADQEAQKKREKLLKQLKEMTDALEREMQEIRDGQRRQQSTSAKMAENIEAQATRQKNVVERMPHEFFRPGQLKIFGEHIEQAKTMRDAGMFDAAAATADAALAELQILEINIQTDQQNWEELFRVYKALATALYNRIVAFEQAATETPGGKFGPMQLPELEYWSNGTYLDIRKQVMDAYKMVQKIAEIGVSEYLRNQENVIRTVQFAGSITALHRLTERVAAVLQCIQNERYFSDERYVFGQLVIKDYFKPQGYHVEDDDCDYLEGEPIDCYELKATVNGLDYLYITIVPIRKDGVAVQNECIITVDLHTTPSQETAQRIATGVTSILEMDLRLMGLQAEWNGHGIKQLPVVASAKKQQPDMKLLARRLERKYQ